MKNLIVLFVALVAAQAALASENPFIAGRTQTRYGNQTVGRFLYTGTAPKVLNAADMEVHLSKVMLTLRVKAWVTEEQRRVYPSQLLLHWDAIRNAFSNDGMTMDPLPSMDWLVQAEKKPERKAQWLIAGRHYMKHNLEGLGVDLYDDELARHNKDKAAAANAYKNKVVLALLREYTLNPSISLEEGLRLVELAKRGDHAGLHNALGPKFFERQLEGHLTETTERPGYNGFLTYVFPTAATTAGPFSIEKEGVYHLGQYSSDEARWHSSRWNDEFGGFPFLAYTSYGIAFHGPITKLSVPGLPFEEFTNNDFWYLNRGYVSHGCHRMDGSDIMELRALLPDDLVRRGSRVPVYSKVWPDSDVFNGERLAINIDYYTPVVSMKKGETPEQVAERNTPAINRALFLQNKIGNLKIPSAEAKGLRVSRLEDNLVVLDGVVTYDASSGRMSRASQANNVRMVSYPFRGTRIIQYRERGVSFSGTEDSGGRYPPSYFTQRRYLKQQ